MPGVVEVDVTTWTPIQAEARGSGANLWLADPAGVQWLYKSTRIPAGSSEPQGEDWAEKLSEQLARLLGVPCAQVEIAVRTVDGRPEHGVVSRDLADGPVDLQNGAVLLHDIPGYRYREYVGGRPRPPRNHRGHSVENVINTLGSMHVGTPVGWDVPGVTAAGVFAGFVVFDAWIANLDRHEENWAVLQRRDRSLTLAPSYDHGAALGSSLTETVRQRLGSDADQLIAFAGKAFGKKFEDGHRVPLTHFAARALRAAGPAAHRFWLERLTSITSADVEEAVAGTPRMSEAARSFCTQLLAINRERVLDVCR